MKYYFMTVIAVILIAGDLAVNKLYQKKYGTSVEMGHSMLCGDLYVPVIKI